MWRIGSSAGRDTSVALSCTLCHGGKGHCLSLCSDWSILGELSHELSDAIRSEQ